ncbi:CoA transferase [Pseudoroseomonas wenyumeiae]
MFRAFPTGYWQALLAREDIIAAPVANYADVTRSEQYTASGIEVAFEHPTAGTVRMPGFAAGSPRPAPEERPSAPWGALAQRAGAVRLHARRNRHADP